MENIPFWMSKKAFIVPVAGFYHRISTCKVAEQVFEIGNKKAPRRQFGQGLFSMLASTR
jgi:hypothetical protein